jgi:excinuclease ABC subunit A
MSQPIVARGVRVHNLKNVDVVIPTGKLVVVTGVSGSGKSSLAFDTLFAEGQRRYVESLSVYARQFLDRMERPALDSMDGICPAVAIRQRPPARNPRSTVATATEIHDHLRLLYARMGRTVCPRCGTTVSRDTAASVAERLRALPEDARAMIAFPAAVGGTPRADLLDRLRKRGFRRLLDGEGAIDLEAAADPAVALGDPLHVVVDRVAPAADPVSRIAEAVETAFAEGAGRAVVQVAGGPRLAFSEAFECARCGSAFVEPEPRLFSFNNPFGACPTCHGFGNLIEVDQELVVPDPSRTLAGGAVEPWNRPRYRNVVAELKRFCRRRGIPLDVAWAALAEEDRRLVLEGDEEFHGVIGFFRWLETRKYKVQVRVFLSRYRGYQVCPDCAGRRLRREALQVKVGGRDIDEVCALSVREARDFMSALAFEGEEGAAAARIVGELERRLRYLADVGLDYLTLGRPFATLSGGEAQRIALAAALGTALVGTLYVLDEPSVGLHPRDTKRLIAILETLRDQGNTVVVVEHDRAIIRVADHVVDLGPGAGEQGGRVVFAGSCRELLAEGRSLTAKYLRGELALTPRPRPRKAGGTAIVVRGARAHNLKGIDARFPLGSMTCVTGVSGSGKSTLVHDVLCAALRRPERGHAEEAAAEGGRAWDSISGATGVSEVVVVDQSPIGRTPRSNPVTYVKAFDPIRELYAETPDAKDRGLTASHFSFNVPGGRCETCSGDGHVRVDMQFLADVSLECEACGGKRYRPEVLEVRWHGRSIDHVLDMTVHEALHFFAGQAAVVRRLKLFEEIGLGYLRLGQSATTLSGGEAQRVKLAVHLARRPGDEVLYVLDEPTTGLHMADVAELLACLARLRDAGATLVVIEHNMDVVRHADWVVDLGPEGGAGGGRLLFEGTPEALAEARTATGRALREAMAGPRVAVAPASSLL